MTAEMMKRYPGMVMVKKDTEARLERLQKEIDEIDRRMQRADKKHEGSDKVISLKAIKEDRMRVTKRLLQEIESSTLEVENALAKAAPDLTPLEMIIITKLYVDGVRWNELLDMLQTMPEYSRFCYERSTYMRAHRSALNKIMNLAR